MVLLVSFRSLSHKDILEQLEFPDVKSLCEFCHCIVESWPSLLPILSASSALSCCFKHKNKLLLQNILFLPFKLNHDSATRLPRDICAVTCFENIHLCHSVCIELLTVLTRPPQSPRHQPLTSIHLGQRPPTPDGVLPPSPHPSPQRSPGGEEGGRDGPEGGGGGAFLQLLAELPSPLPSPRCSSPSLRFSSDPDAAPSPPCSQQYILWASSACLLLFAAGFIGSFKTLTRWSWNGNWKMKDWPKS